MDSKKGDEKAGARLSRREVLTGVLGAAATAGLAACGGSSSGDGSEPIDRPMPPDAVTLPSPEDAGFDHVVIVMMENRTFDHMMGWVPGADGIQVGVQYEDKNGDLIQSFPLAEHQEYGFQGCGKEDPAHNYSAGRAHFAGGAMDGFLKTVGDASVEIDHFPVGYYRREDLPFFDGCATHWTIFDRFFHGILASTFPNRMYLHSGQTDRTSNSLDISSLPTIWDRADSAGLSSAYYFHDLPVTALWGAKYLTRSRRFESFLLEAALGQLPNISIVDPRFLGEAPNGISNDDHPQADVRNGQAFMASIYDAVRNSPNWERTVLVYCYDEWGGFYDHVAPPLAPVSADEAALENDGRLGFRVPAIVIGPRARRGHVAHEQYDINSVLNMVCWRWGLEPLGVRGDWSLNLAYALDFDAEPDLSAPDFGVPLGPFGVECTTGLPFPIPTFPGSPLKPGELSSASISHAQHNLEWLSLRNVARKYGFDV